jgi:gluconokinase
MPFRNPRPPNLDAETGPLIVVVMGVAGCGKTTLGEALADRLQAPFIEGDAHHPKRNVEKMAAGVPLTDEDRWPWLDRLGGALASAAGRTGSVVGACSALRRVYRERLSAATGLPIRFVCLAGSGVLIARRMQSRSGHFMPVSLLESQLALLELPAPDEAAVVLPLSAGIGDLIDRTLGWLAIPPVASDGEGH